MSRQPPIRSRPASRLRLAAVAAAAAIVLGCGSATGTPRPSAAAASSAPPPASSGAACGPALPGLPSVQTAAIVPPPGSAPPAIALRQVASGLSAPLGIVSPRDGSGRLFVVEQGGLIRVLGSDGRLLERPFLDVTALTAADGERGLLGLAFHPAYRCNGRFFINYTDQNGDTVVAEYRVSAGDANVADPQPVARLLHIAQPYPNHNGGDLAFGPDGDLYVGMGDGGDAEDPQGNGQRLDTLLGKLLRLDVDAGPTGSGAAPAAGNCAGCAAGFLPEIDAYGLRNPWRFSFDHASGDLWIGDVGQDRFEEVDHLPAAAASGANFGWSVMEATHCLHGSLCDRAGKMLPVAEYDHSNGDCAVTGGYVYRGTAIPALQGWYLLSDSCSGRIRAVSSALVSHVPGSGASATPAGAAASVILEPGGSIATFGEGEDGELYVADIAAGTIAEVVAAP